MLVVCKMWKLFVNTLSADDKYCLLNRDNLMQPVQILLSEKQKTIFRLLFAFLKSRLNFEHFQKKRWPSQPMCFLYNGLRKRWLEKFLKNSVSEDPWTRNMVNVPKHCWILEDRNFTECADHCEHNSVGKNLS